MADDDTMDGSANTRSSFDALATQHLDVERNSAECLSEDQVVLFLEGLTTSRHRDEIHQHLDACQICRLLVQSLASDYRASNPGASSPFRITTFATGSLIAERYRIERFVGNSIRNNLLSYFNDQLVKRFAISVYGVFDGCVFKIR